MEETTQVAVVETVPNSLDFSQPSTRAAAIDALEGQVLLIQEAMARTLVRGVHYGTIPGTPRPSLWQPGAEMLSQMFGFKTYIEQTNSHEDWDKGLFAYQFKCTLADRNNNHITERFATCSTKERQYRKQIENGQDPAELRETLMLMAQKRAYVAAVRSAGACSAVFTQDDDIVPDPNQATTATSSNVSAPSQRRTSGISIPCQMGHAGQFWTSSKYAPAHAATPKWCSITNWAKAQIDAKGMEWFIPLAQGLGRQYSKWTDENWQTFFDRVQKEVEEEVQTQQADDHLRFWGGLENEDEEQLNF